MTTGQVNSSAKRKRPVPPFKLHIYYPTKRQQIFDQISNLVFNQLYPVKPSLFVGLFILSFAYLFSEHGRAESSLLSIFALSFGIAFIPVILLRTFLWTFFFRYKRYLFEDPKRPSLATKFWVVCSRLLRRFAPPRLLTCNTFLPRLSVPRLKDTINRYLESMQPLLDENEYLELKDLAHNFEENEGPKLNRYAWAYSLYTRNYVTGFWEKYLYRYDRSPLLINSNIGHIDTVKMPQNASQVSRAVDLCYVAALNMTAIANQSEKPVANGLCYTGHYGKLYATSRVPGVECDEWKINGYSRHVVVYANGRFYKVDLFDKRTNRLYSVEELDEVFTELLLRKDKPPTNVEQKLAALTQDRRDTWAKNRERFFLENPKNRKFIDLIEESIAFVVLDENEYDYEEGDYEKITEFQRNMLTGNGRNRWTDKSMNFIIGRNGRMGGCSEHSFADGAEYDTVLENYIAVSARFLSRQKEPIDIDKIDDFQPRSGVALAERLDFEIVSDEMKSEIERCYIEQLNRSSDLDAASMIFTDFGKDAIKKAGCSPDAFMQMAIQLANYKDQGKFVLTYESASARFYDFSRTETLRTVTKQSCSFVRAMIDKKESREQCATLLRESCDLHQKRNRCVMTGEGIDRHLFVLYVLSKGLSIKSAFLEKYISQKWLLSTSQPPIMTNQLDEDVETEQWLGGGFGAVAHEGYGVCYRFMSHNSIACHITSYHSAPNTNSTRFRAHLEDSLREMIELFG